MTFTEMAQEVTYRLGNRGDLAARIPNWLDQAYMELVITPRFMFFELDQSYGSMVTVSGTRRYSLSGMSDLWVITHIRDETNQRRLERSDLRELDALYQVTANGQQPYRYARYGNEIELDPTPGGAYMLTVRYRKRPAIWSSGNHALGREWDEVLLDMATIKGLEALQRHEEAGAQRQLLEMKMSLREEAVRLEDADAETTIGVLRSGWH